MGKRKRRTRRAFSDEFKAETVKLVRGSDKSIAAIARERGRRDAGPLKVLASLGYLGGSRRDIVLDRPAIDDRVGDRLEAAHNSREPPRLPPTCEHLRDACMSRHRAGIKTRRGMVPGR